MDTENTENKLDLIQEYGNAVIYQMTNIVQIMRDAEAGMPEALVLQERAYKGTGSTGFTMGMREIIVDEINAYRTAKQAQGKT